MRDADTPNESPVKERDRLAEEIFVAASKRPCGCYLILSETSLPPIMTPVQ